MNLNIRPGETEKLSQYGRIKFDGSVRAGDLVIIGCCHDDDGDLKLQGLTVNLEYPDGSRDDRAELLTRAILARELAGRHSELARDAEPVRTGDEEDIELAARDAAEARRDRLLAKSMYETALTLLEQTHRGPGYPPEPLAEEPAPAGQYQTWQEFEQDDSQRSTMKVQYGAAWRLDGSDGQWSISYIPATGEIYALRNDSQASPKVMLLGTVETQDELDRITEGWAQVQPLSNSLQWIIQRAANGVPEARGNES